MPRTCHCLPYFLVGSSEIRAAVASREVSLGSPESGFLVLWAVSRPLDGVFEAGCGCGYFFSWVPLQLRAVFLVLFFGVVFVRVFGLVTCVPQLSTGVLGAGYA